MIRSRLRSPMSKSITATFLPRRASPQARLAEVVVFPTPPLPEVTTIISVNAWVSSFAGVRLLFVDPGCPSRATRATHALHPRFIRQFWRDANLPPPATPERALQPGPQESSRTHGTRRRSTPALR